jgi:hypothetical protein
MSGFRRKLKRKNVVVKTASALTEAEYQDIVERVKNDLIEKWVYKVMAIAADAVMNNYGKLKNKETRISVLAKLFEEGLDNIDKMPNRQLEVARILEKHGMKVEW